MPDITKNEKRARSDVLNKCYTYLRDNFHKFSDSNKIRVALELVKKDMPSNNKHDVETQPIRLIWEINGHQAEITPQPRQGMAGQKQV